jgi:glycosyltransferase involved in cell wall biosynthesis
MQMTENGSDPIRVLELVSGIAIEEASGGVARFVTELVQAMDRRRICPFVVAIWDYKTPYEQPRAAQLSAAGVPTILASTFDDKRAYWSCVTGLASLRHVLPPQRIDIVHSHGELSDLAAIMVRHQVAARRLVRTVHSEREWGKRPLWGKLFPNLVHPWFFDADVAVSRRTADNLNRRPLARLLDKQATYIPNALNFARFSTASIDCAAKRRSLGVPVDAWVVGSVGRLAPQKAYDVLLAAAPLVLAQHPNAHFVIVGTGAQKGALEAQARSLGIAGQVTFTGARSDVIELLKTFDLFVSSSRYEGLPTVILEAMAVGIPVVATRVSGNIELIEDGVSGLLAPPEDPAALAAAIVTMTDGQRPVVEMTRCALERANKLYSIEAVAGRYADFYCDLAEKSKR